jgi:hypothetical protein
MNHPIKPISQAVGPSPAQLSEIAHTMSQRELRAFDDIVKSACIMRERSEFRRKFESKLARIKL